MSSSSWQASLSWLLQNPKPDPAGRPRLAIVGIGNELRGDDVAGSLVARSLAVRAGMLAEKQLVVIEAGHAPENVTGLLRRFGPQSVLLVDAAEMGERPGTVRWLALEEISGMTASTHSMPLSMLAAYLKIELDCPVAVLGIQPASNDYGAALSPAVKQAVEEVVGEIGGIVDR